MAQSQQHGQCDVCMEHYDETKRTPKFLACFHTFCYTCLQNLEGNFTITCPTCRRETSVGINGVDSLQSNFYILAKDVSSTATPDGSKKSDSVDPIILFWCTQCHSTAKGKCQEEKHDINDLESQEGQEMAQAHLNMHLTACKVQWNAALTKRREVTSHWNAVHSAIKGLLQQVEGNQQQNLYQINQLQFSLSELENTSTEHLKGRDLKDLLEKYSFLAGKSKKQSKEATNLWSAFEKVRDCVANVEVTTPGDESLPVPTLSPAKLNFTSSPDSNELGLETVLSFLVLSSSFGDQIVKPPSLLKGLVKDQQSSARTSKTAKPKQPNQFPPQGGAKPKKVQQHEPIAHQTQSTKAVEGEKKPFKPPKNPKGPGSQPPGPGNKTKGPVMEGQQTPTKPALKPTSGPPVLFPFSPPVLAPTASIGPTINLRNKKAFMIIAINGKTYGKMIIELRPDVAPIMCQKFAQCCQGGSTATDNTYCGTIIYKAVPKLTILGGRTRGNEELYMADRSPLKKTRGAIFMRLKRDYIKTQCSIVSTEYGVCLLGDENASHHRESTVFGYVSEGLAVCDAISHMDCEKDHIAIATAGLQAG